MENKEYSPIVISGPSGSGKSVLIEYIEKQNPLFLEATVSTNRKKRKIETGRMYFISKEEFETLINNLRDKLDETTVALVSEEILATISAYNNGFDEYTKSVEEVEKLKGEKEELLRVNGKLYQRIGFDREEKEDNIEDGKNEEEIKIEDVIDEKGELI